MEGLAQPKVGANGAARVAATVMLLVALALHAAIPAGWMPNTAGVPKTPLVICPGGAMHMHGVPGTAAPGRPHHSDRHDVCAFAGLGFAPSAPAALISEAHGFLVLARLDPAPDHPALVSAQHREQSARGPPPKV